MRRIFPIIAGLCILCLTACEDTTYVPDPQFDYEYKQKQFATLAGQFDYIWTGLNNSYLFWDVDTTDWDAVREEYLPKFQELDELGQKGETVTNEMIFKLISKVDSLLLDRHSCIWMSNPYTEYRRAFCTNKAQMIYNEKEITLLEWADVYAKKNLFKNYEISNEKETSYNDGYRRNAYSCVIDNSIPVLYLGKYLFTKEDFIKQNPEVLVVVNNFIDNVRTLSLQGRLKGVILDNRFNTGGTAKALEVFVQIFSTKKIEPCRQRSKVGLGKFDYSPWSKYIIKPNSERYIDIHNAPIVVLQNKFSMSTGELVGHALSFLPNTYIIGEKTFGAQSCLSSSDSFANFHSGSFNSDSVAGNQAAVKTAIICCKQKNKKTGKYEQLEGIGFEPDEYVELNVQDFIAGTGDNQLEAALNYIRKKNQ